MWLPQYRLTTTCNSWLNFSARAAKVPRKNTLFSKRNQSCFFVGREGIKNSMVKQVKEELSVSINIAINCLACLPFNNLWRYMWKCAEILKLFNSTKVVTFAFSCKCRFTEVYQNSFILGAISRFSNQNIV